MSECKPHKAFFGEDDCCPICEGIQAERERIIALLEAESIEFFKLANDSEKKKHRRISLAWGYALQHAKHMIEAD